MIGVVLHEGGSAFQSLAHHLRGADQSGGLPVSFGSKAVTVRHQPLHGDSGKLFETVQILERVGESMGSSVLEEVPQPEFNPGSFTQRLPLATAGTQAFRRGIGFIVASGKLVYLSVGYVPHPLDEIANSVPADGVAKIDLSAHLVTLGDRDIPHVVPEAGNLQVLSVVPSACCAGPGSD